jgi:perosamine synthetase
MIAISLSPNTQSDDVIAALKSLLKMWQWRDRKVVARAASRLSDKLGRPAVLTSSGRAAIYILLHAYDITAGDEVIVQAFTCSIVPAAIQWAGAKPVYADINPQTYNLDPADVSRKITARTKAIIVQHTFGIPGPVDELRALAQPRGIMVIEDCAHALGAVYHGHPVGTLADAAILSFGRDKVLSSIYGGAIVSHDQHLITKVTAIQQELADAPLIWIKQQLLHPILFSLILPLYGRFGIGQALLVASQKLGLLSKALEPQEKRGGKPRHLTYRFPGALALLLEHQLSKLDRYTERRRRAARTYQVGLQNIPGQAQPLPQTEPSWLRFPLRVKNPAALHRAARRQRIQLGDWYDTPLAPADCDPAAFGYQSGSCPRAEQTARHIINLPTYPRLKESELQEVISLIRDVTHAK